MTRLSHITAALLLAVLAAQVAVPAARAADEASGDPEAVKHSADGHYLNFAPFGMVELPRLFLARTAEGGLTLDAYGSTKAALEYGPYRMVDAEGHFLSEADAEEAMHGSHHEYIYYPLQRAEGAVLVDFSITRHTAFLFLCALIVLGVVLQLASRYKKGIGREEAPRGLWQNTMESIIVFIREDIAKPSIGPKYKRYMPYLVTVFIFILLSNLMGLIPWGASATSNIMVTGALALFTFLITQLSGSKDHWKHIFWPPGVPLLLKPIMIPVEIIGQFTKALALAFRLFGNMVSGHLVIVSILGLIFIFAAQLGPGYGAGTILVSIPLTIFIYLLKIVVSFVQAYIFVILSAVFIGMAVAEHHHDEEEHLGEMPESIEGDGMHGGTIDELVSPEAAAASRHEPSLAG